MKRERCACKLRHHDNTQTYVSFFKRGQTGRSNKSQNDFSNGDKNLYLLPDEAINDTDGLAMVINLFANLLQLKRLSRLFQRRRRLVERQCRQKEELRERDIR